MSEPSLIALLSDFGEQDGYVGVMKGVIAKINPQLRVIDITHQIPPQNVAAGRFCLMNAYPYFPDGTVYVAVVDPGVGSRRRGIAVQVDKSYLVGPDNGLFSGVLSLEKAIAAVELTNPQYWRVPTPSLTFHGRDIFASVGAYLASGVSLDKIGTPIALDSLVELSLRGVQITEGKIGGCIQYIDHFGNLITNIPAESVRDKHWSVQIGENIIVSGLIYNDVASGELVALKGSHGWIEIAVNGGSAQKQLQANWGTEVDVFLG